MPANVPGEVLVDGSLDFSGGVDSIKTTTIQSQSNPNGMARNELCWLDNATVRDGGITQRTGWQLIRNLNNGNVLYQGGFMYQPLNGNPYLILCFSGHVYKTDPAGSSLVDLSSQFGVYHPTTAPKFFFCQGEEFLVIQAGDGSTLPLFWDGTTLRRSRGLLGTADFESAAQTTYSVVLSNTNAPVGTVFPADGTTTNPLKAPYNQFVAPDVGSTVTVTLNGATIVTAPSVVTFPMAASGQMQLQSISHGADWAYTYTNLSIPQGTAVASQYADSTTPGDGATFPAFTAPNIGSTYVFHFTNQLVNPGIVNNWKFDCVFNATLVLNGEAQTQAVISELPAAGPMVYYMHRIWYAQGQKFTGGDAIGGYYGTVAYQFRDSILKVTENPLAVGGDGFAVPTTSGQITSMFFTANINAAMGWGVLLVSTSKYIFAYTIPLTRADWTSEGTQNSPQMQIVQFANGVAGDRSVVLVNGDAFFQSLEPGIRSLFTAVRYFSQWGNIEISSNEQRILNFVDRSLLNYSTGILFDNRLLESSLPVPVPQGVVHQAIVPLDFIPLSQFGSNFYPVWEGMYEGLDFFQLFVGNFGGLERAFAVTLDRNDKTIDLWELTNYQRFNYNEHGEVRVTWLIEFPAMTWGREFSLKKLVGCEVWVDKVYGTVDFKMDFRPDGEPCWKPWHQWQVCTAKNSCEDVMNPVCYPLTNYREAYRQTMNLPVPPDTCETVSGRPANEGYQFQCRLTITGWCRIRGIMLKALPMERKTYQDITC